MCSSNFFCSTFTDQESTDRRRGLACFPEPCQLCLSRERQARRRRPSLPTSPSPQNVSPEVGGRLFIILGSLRHHNHLLLLSLLDHVRQLFLTALASSLSFLFVNQPLADAQRPLLHHPPAQPRRLPPSLALQPFH